MTAGTEISLYLIRNLGALLLFAGAWSREMVGLPRAKVIRPERKPPEASCRNARFWRGKSLPAHPSSSEAA